MLLIVIAWQSMPISVRMRFSQRNSMRKSLQVQCVTSTSLVFFISMLLQLILHSSNGNIVKATVYFCKVATIFDQNYADQTV